MTLTTTELLLLFPAAFRFTWLITADHITEGWRRRIQRSRDQSKGLGYWVGCPWCAGVPVSAALVVFALLVPASWSVPLLAVPAVSGVVGFVASYVD